MSKRNKVIDECIAKLEELIKPNCHDHTPYRGECVTCGNMDNWDTLNPEDVIEELKNMKQYSKDAKHWWNTLSDYTTNELIIKHQLKYPINEVKIIEMYKKEKL